MTKIPTLIPVVALALIDDAGRILMQQRLGGDVYAGLWEFPGGKVKGAETAEQALLREIEEELGIRIEADDLEAVGFASDPALPPAPRDPHVILLYTAGKWHGEVQCLAADSVGWFAPHELADLAMPPLDVPLASALLRLISARQA